MHAARRIERTLIISCSGRYIWARKKVHWSSALPYEWHWKVHRKVMTPPRDIDDCNCSAGVEDDDAADPDAAAAEAREDMEPLPPLLLPASISLTR